AIIPVEPHTTGSLQLHRGAALIDELITLDAQLTVPSNRRVADDVPGAHAPRGAAGRFGSARASRAASLRTACLVPTGSTDTGCSIRRRLATRSGCVTRSASAACLVGRSRRWNARRRHAAR